MWKLPILFPVSHPAILEYLGSDENRVPHFLEAAESAVLTVQRVVLFSVVFGIFHSFLAASLAVKEAELVLMPTACPLLKCNKFTEIFVRRRLYVLNMSKTPATQPSMAD
jgi:CBS domain containing-hemolysin-like protein